MTTGRAGHTPMIGTGRPTPEPAGPVDLWHLGMSLVTYGNYVAGWLDLTVGDVIERFPKTYKRLAFAVITCLDSNHDPAKLLDASPELGPLRADATTLGTSLILPTKALLEVQRNRPVLFGFDEIWFFPRRPEEPAPYVGRLVGPARVSDEALGALGPWMSRQSCSFALGGGEGVNFVVKALGLVQYLLGFSYFQSASGDPVDWEETPSREDIPARGSVRGG